MTQSGHCAAGLLRRGTDERAFLDGTNRATVCCVTGLPTWQCRLPDTAQVKPECLRILVNGLRRGSAMREKSPGQLKLRLVAPAAGQEELLTILNGTPFLVTRCTADLKYANVSGAYAAMLGRRPQDLEGRPIVDFMGKEAFEALLPHIRKVLLGERVEYETVVKYLGVGPRTVQFTYVPDWDAEGGVRG